MQWLVRFFKNVRSIVLVSVIQVFGERFFSIFDYDCDGPLSLLFGFFAGTLVPAMLITLEVSPCPWSPNPVRSFEFENFCLNSNSCLRILRDSLHPDLEQHGWRPRRVCTLLSTRRWGPWVQFRNHLLSPAFTPITSVPVNFFRPRGTFL